VARILDDIVLDDIIIRTCSRIMIPFIQLYSLYVLVHGHTSPGGGFQGGCIMAASLILLAVSFSINEVKRLFTEKYHIIFCALGVFIYAGTGAADFFFSGNFLDYSKWANMVPTSPVKARYYGMALVELGVQISVMAVMVSIFFDLVTKGDHEEAPELEDD
jgi:multicomponent Na+:H+ antiporter subunit B